jgi:N-acetyl-gamma-glutamylphosphate reductase
MPRSTCTLTACASAAGAGPRPVPVALPDAQLVAHPGCYATASRDPFRAWYSGRTWDFW